MDDPWVVVETERGRTRFGPGTSVRMGRDPQLEITIVDSVVSREHARLTWDDGWLLVDADSKNGIYGDGERRREIPVRGPVRVRLGDATEGPVVRISVEDPDATRQDVGGRWDESTVSVDVPQPTPHASIPAGSLTIGRSPDNDIVVKDVLAYIAVTTCTCVLVGLALSSVARSNEQVLPMLVVTIMAQLVTCGGLITITGRAVLEQFAWLFPSRWGFAAAASTVDLVTNATGTEPDTLWQHTASWWLLSIAMLLLLSLVLAVFTYTRLRLRALRAR